MSPRLRWWFYTKQTAKVGTRGPFGPIEAVNRQRAWDIAEARARRSGLTVERIEPVRPESEAEANHGS